MTQNLPSGLPSEIDLDEDIARFLTSSNQFSKLNGPKPNAFLPDTTSKETSVSRHGYEPVESLWKLGAIAAGSRNLHGAAMIKSKHVNAVGLLLEADEPPDRHAVIRGWPWMDSENDRSLEKARQLEFAIELSAYADLFLKD